MEWLGDRPAVNTRSSPLPLTSGADARRLRIDAMHEYQGWNRCPRGEWSSSLRSRPKATRPLETQRAKEDVVQAHPDIVGEYACRGRRRWHRRDCTGHRRARPGRRRRDDGPLALRVGCASSSSRGRLPKFVLVGPLETGYLTTVIAFELVNGRDIVDGQELPVAPGVTRSIPIREIRGESGFL